MFVGNIIEVMLSVLSGCRPVAESVDDVDQAVDPAAQKKRVRKTIDPTLPDFVKYDGRSKAWKVFIKGLASVATFEKKFKVSEWQEEGAKQAAISYGEKVYPLLLELDGMKVKDLKEMANNHGSLHP